MLGSHSVKKREAISQRPSSSSAWSGTVAPGALPGGWGSCKSTKQSTAKDWVERCNAKRELEALKQQQWLDVSKQFKTAQLKADLYHHKPSAPRCCPTPIPQNGWDSETSSHIWPVHEGQDAQELPSQLPPPSNQNNDQGLADEADAASNPSSKSMEARQVPRILSDGSAYLKPEIAALKARLEELKKRNAEERQKLNEELSYKAWQTSSTEARQMESERLQQFVRSAWIDQRKWKEDEKLRRELEDRKIEEEAAAIRRRHEEHEHRMAREKQAKREQYQKELEEQLEAIKRQKEEKARLDAAANNLMCERDKLLVIAERRERLLQARKSRSLAVSWARQHHIKLRQRAVQVMQEVNEDLALVRDFLDLQTKDHPSEAPEQNDLNFVMGVLEEHKKLEQLREKEYDLLFSEEAARLWRMREQQWEREAEARNKLLREVLLVRQRQIDEKDKIRAMAEDKLKQDCAESQQRIANVEESLFRLEDEKFEASSGEGGGRLGDTCKHDGLPRGDTSYFDEQQEAKHRKEIARLEEEMARLWGPLYTPPYYGRKKVTW